jgi:uncharacterized protein (TIGR00251 family)
MSQSALYSTDSHGLILAVRAQPKASRDAIVGVMATSDGQSLKVAVTAAPDKGKANAAIAALVAEAFDVPKTAVSIIAGVADRRKLLRIVGNPTQLTARARQLIKNG